MSKIEKHKFEAVSLLTVDNGLLDVTIIPASNQPDWVIPSDLILSIENQYDSIWNYHWNNQEVAVYHLISDNESPHNIIVLEGNTNVHRIGLLTKGSLRKWQVRISDVKDVVLSTNYAQFDIDSDILINDSGFHSIQSDDIETLLKPELTAAKAASNSKVLPYLYQTVDIRGQIYIVPNLDELAHHLVDLDS